MQTQTQFTDNSLMPFGVHRGKPMINIPAKYLLWLYNEGCNHDGVKKYLIENLEALNKEAGNNKR
ncbi:MAG: putative quorum-sensing-regulated virulence factor [Candidatus Methylacidiphilales bacterium]